MQIAEKIVFATNNKHKVFELHEWFARNFDEVPEIITLSQLGLADPDENGTTFAQNAFIKADYAFEHTGLASIADDSGLCVDALGGRPGVYSARYAGEGKSDGDRIAKLLDELKDVPLYERTAHFACALCMLLPDGTRIDAYGVSEGYILESPRGNDDFGYDPVFYCPVYGKTFAELDIESKTAVSHRGKALAELKSKLRTLL